MVTAGRGVALALLGLAVVGCGRGPAPAVSPSPVATDTAAPESAFYPMGVGYRWTYRDTEFDRATERELAHHTLTLRADRMEGDFYAMVEERDGQLVGEFRQSVAPDGVRTVEFETSKTGTLLFRSPLSVGLEWDVASDRRAIVKAQESFEFEGRSLPSFVVQYERFYDKQWLDEPRWEKDGELWFAPGVGIVRRDMKSVVIPNRRQRYKLSSDPSDPTDAGHSSVPEPSAAVPPALPTVKRRSEAGGETYRVDVLERFEKGGASGPPASAGQ